MFFFLYRFRQYGLWERYAELYPDEDLVYTVGESDYTKDWFFAHVTRYYHLTIVSDSITIFLNCLCAIDCDVSSDLQTDFKFIPMNVECRKEKYIIWINKNSNYPECQEEG